MISIENDGQQIRSTNYWETEHAAHGLCYLSGNAGAWRLLVPTAAASLLIEMRTGKCARIEQSLYLPGRAYDIVFDDGTDTPFALTIDPKQIDRVLEPRTGLQLLVYTPKGLEMTVPCDVS